MKVKILEGRAGKDYVMKKGEIVGVSDSFGKPLIDKGKAEKVQNERSTDKGQGQPSKDRAESEASERSDKSARTGKSPKAGQRPTNSGKRSTGQAKNKRS